MKQDASVLTGFATMQCGTRAFRYCAVAPAAARHGRKVSELPYAARVLVENLERSRMLEPDGVVADDDVAAAACFGDHVGRGVPLRIARVILPDSSGVPVLQDLAALRDAVARSGGDPLAVDPQVPVDLVVDHSLQVDRAGSIEAMAHNMRREFERNGERYRFLKWAENAFAALRVFPPGTGIIHQVNLEFIAPVVLSRDIGGERLAYPDFVIGGDSHTPMVNGIGVLGWGVGGIDAEAAMLGEAYVFPIPEMVGVRLVGRLPAGVTTTDLVLLVTERLRREKVVGAIVEYFGEGARSLSIPERATVANMAPEYGATAGFFPIDERTIAYLGETRGAEAAAFVEAYARANHLFRAPGMADPLYGRVIEIDLSRVELSVAGPRRPQDRLPLAEVAEDFRARLDRPLAEGGFAAMRRGRAPGPAGGDGAPPLDHGSIVIAAITSCTNTSNPAVMVAAGLVARKAAALGLAPAPHVKTSLAPGSRVVTKYLAETGLLGDLELLGFHLVGYGCTTCAGKSGPLDPAVAEAIRSGDLIAAAVLSGNRNFEGRIHRLVRANYIMSPPLVVICALAGRIDIDVTRDPVARTADGRAVFLADLWPSAEEVEALVRIATRADLFRETYASRPDVMLWDEMEAPTGPLYPWDPRSLYLVEPPFFALAGAEGARGLPDRLAGARVLALFGDSLTTDHISPGGEIPPDSPAGRYLIASGVAPKEFNTYVGRRGNHEVMARATFANLRIKNLLVPEVEGGVTRRFPDDVPATIHDAAMAYRAEGTPVIVLAGKEYGTGSSRDWAAKGPALLGVRAVIAESFERIHRSNLIGMGVLPLRFADGEGWRSLGLDGTELYEIAGIGAGLRDGSPILVTAQRNGTCRRFQVTAEVLTESERRTIAAGGTLPAVLGRFLARRDNPGGGGGARPAARMETTR